MRFLNVGTRGLLVELEDLEQAMGLFQNLKDDPPPGTRELVPAARTVLVTFDPQTVGRRQLGQVIAGREAALCRQDPSTAREVEIPVLYDGPDLEETARATGLAIRELLERHTAARYTVTFGGFAPGFAYLSGLDPALHLPRRSVPRAHVPAGSVAIADRFAGIYPRTSPGGWHLLGHTESALWDPARPQPALLTPGQTVRFVQVKP